MYYNVEHFSSHGGMVKILKMMTSLGWSFYKLTSSLHTRLSDENSLTYVMSAMMPEMIILNFWSSRMQVMGVFPHWFRADDNDNFDDW